MEAWIDISRALDRCLSLHKEYTALEDSQTAGAQTHKLFRILEHSARISAVVGLGNVTLDVL